MNEEEKNKFEGKSKRTLILLIVFSIIVIVVLTYFWFYYFLDIGSDGTLGKVQRSNSAIVILDDNKVYATYTKESSHKMPAYSFKVENNGLNTKRYRVKINDIAPKVINDGCTEKTFFARKELYYELYRGGNLISEGNLSSIKNSILDEHYVQIDETIKYQLVVKVDDSVPEESFGKHYHYKLELEVLN